MRRPQTAPPTASSTPMYRTRGTIIAACIVLTSLSTAWFAAGQPGDPKPSPLPPADSESEAIPELPTPSEVDDSQSVPPAATPPAAQPSPTVQQYTPPARPPEQQDSDEDVVDKDVPETLFGGNQDIVFGGFGGVNVRYTRVLGHDGVWVGGEGALLLNHSLSVGAGGGGVTNTISPTQGKRLEFGYGGVIFRYHFFSSQLVNFAVGGLVGAGGLGLVDADTSDEDIDWEEVGEAVFVLEPELGLYLNITRWMRLGITGGYRFVSGVEKNDLSETDVRGATGGGSIQFGWF